MCEVRFPTMVSRCLTRFEGVLRQIQRGHADPEEVEDVLACGAATCKGLADLGLSTTSLVGWCLHNGGVIPCAGTLRALARAAENFDGTAQSFGTDVEFSGLIRYVHMLSQVLEQQSRLEVPADVPAPLPVGGFYRILILIRLRTF